MIYNITMQTTGYANYTVDADSEEEAILKVKNGDVVYDCHDWSGDEPFVESVDAD